MNRFARRFAPDSDEDEGQDFTAAISDEDHEDMI